MNHVTHPRRTVFPISRSLVASLLAILAACGGGGQTTATPDVPGLPELPGAPELPGTPKFTGWQNFQSAEMVLGQSSFEDAADNQGGGSTPNASSLSEPGGVALRDDGTIFVADSGNSRVLAFRPERSGQDAAFVLGQENDFSRGDPATDEYGYIEPFSISIANGKMAVADRSANRVVIYETDPVDGSARPTVVVGQQDFASNSSNCDEFTLAFPNAVLITPDGKLVVADTDNSRVLIWKSVPNQNGKAADVVLGQPHFFSCSENAGGAVSRGSMYTPRGIWSDGKRLAVADTVNHRLLFWDEVLMSVPTGQEPARIIGQGSYDLVIEESPFNDTVRFPTALASNGTHFAVSDSGNNRVLLWNSYPTADLQAADTVIGQIDFVHGDANDADGVGGSDGAPKAQTLRNPLGLAFHENKLLIVDAFNNRLLIFKSQ